MGPVYATRLTVYSANIDGMRDLGARVINVCNRFLGRACAEFDIPWPGYDEHVRAVDTLGRVSSLQITHLDHEDDRAWRARLQHPLLVDGSLKRHSLLITEIDVWDDDDAVVVTVRASVVRTRDMVHPLDVTRQVPDVVHMLVNSFEEVSAGGLRCTVSAGCREGAHVARHVISHNRYIPLVVIANDDPDFADHIASRLTGMARVYRLPAGEIKAFNTRFPEGHQLAAGGVRLYWPEYSAIDDASRHLTIPPDIATDADATALYLVRIIAPAAVVGFGDDDQVVELQARCDTERYRAQQNELKEKGRQLLRTNKDLRLARDAVESSRSARAAAEQARNAAIERQRTAEAEADQKWEQTRAEHERKVAEAVANERHAEEVVANYSADIRQKEADINELWDALHEREEEIYRVRAKLAAQDIARPVPHQLAPNPLDVLSRVLECKTNYDAVLVAAELLGDEYVLMTDTTWKSLGNSGFTLGPTYMVQQLALLHRMAKRYFTTPNTTYENALNAAGAGDATFAAKVTGHMAQDKLQWYDLTWQRLDGTSASGRAEMHLSYGRGSKSRGFRIYFLVDDVDKRFVVGKFGNHGPGINKL